MKGANASSQTNPFDWDAGEYDWSRLHGRNRDGTIWMYHVGGDEYHGGQAPGKIYTSRDLDYISMFATPESHLRVIRVNENALKPSPEGQRRYANLFQESIIDPADIIEEKRFPLLADTYQEARERVTKPHALARLNAAVDMIRSGQRVPDKVLPEVPQKFKQSNIKKSAMGLLLAVGLAAAMSRMNGGAETA